MKSPKWTEIGFQQKNPRTDFRGGGLLALHSLYYLLAYKPEFFKEMKDFSLDENN